MTSAQKAVLAMVAEGKPRTAVEIDVECGYRDAHKRITELSDGGYIKPIGYRRSFGSRIESRVWTLTEKGRRALR